MCVWELILLEEESVALLGVLNAPPAVPFSKAEHKVSSHGWLLATRGSVEQRSAGV